jgi:hypothetical protein
MKTLCESTVMEHFGVQLLFPFSPAAGRPLAAEIANLSGNSKHWQLRQRSHEDGFVTPPLVRQAERSADRVVDEGGARWGNLTHDVVGRADD